MSRVRDPLEVGTHLPPRADEFLDIDHLRSWIGNVEEATDFVTSRAVRAMRSALSLSTEECPVGAAAPLSMHWCYLLDLTSGPGSSPRVDGGIPFVPPVPLAQRMWAGGRTEFVEPLRVGDVVNRHSKIAGVAVKQGRSGPLCFVSIEHTYSTARGLATKDLQTLVFRDSDPMLEARPVAPPAPSPRTPQHSKVMEADAALLFHYSALTHNAHRSHYDRPFATGVEGHPGLMVHGPLQAAVLLEYAIELRGAGAPISFSHRGVSSMFEGDFTVNAHTTPDGFELWTANAAGGTYMTAEASW